MVTRDWNVTWGPVDTRADMVTDGFDEPLDDDDMQGNSQGDGDFGSDSQQGDT